MKSTRVPDFLIVWSGLLLSLAQMGIVSSDTSIVVNAPVNPVDQFGILAVHCQVRNLQSADEVVFLRTINGKTKKLSDDNTEFDDRIFIAVRQMEDGSTVYFLSLTGATDADDGEYSCKVIRYLDTIKEIASDKVEISIVHFPSEGGPKCASSNDKLEVREGRSITLNCSSSIGNPPVKITWNQVGSSKKLPSNEITSGGVVYSELTIRPRAGEPVFLCQIESPAFPTLRETCHLGPIRVIRDPNSSPLSPYDTGNTATSLTPFEIITQRPKIEVKPSTKCSQICATKTSEHQLYWIIGTIFMAILAIFFFAIFVGLLMKYLKRLRNNNNRTKYKAPYEQRPHKVYEELEIRRCGGQVYMALDKTKNIGHESIYTDKRVECLDNVNNEPMISR